MATAETTSPHPNQPELEDVAHAQSNRLHDVRALLIALQELTPTKPEGADPYFDNVRRIARVAADLVDDVQEAFAPFI